MTRNSTRADTFEAQSASVAEKTAVGGFRMTPEAEMDVMISALSPRLAKMEYVVVGKTPGILPRQSPDGG